MTWRSIKDDPPPKDGTVILAYAKHSQVMSGKYHRTEVQFDRMWRGLSPLHNWPASFDYWMPLPEPPDA
jgi:hypothetical protein